MDTSNKNSTEQYINPFPVTAVASRKGDMQNSLTIETASIIKSKKIVGDFINNKYNGATIAIIGEYGTGKTQLAIEILDKVRDESSDSCHYFYLDSPSDNFLELYQKRFLPQLDKEQVIERLEECYLDILLKDFSSDELYKNFPVSELKGKKCSVIIEQFGLIKSRYDRIFEEQLGAITKNKKFVTPLLLLLQPHFIDDVWNWFGGNEPIDSLKERGIDFCIKNDVLALQAMETFSFLFGQQNHKFILVIDELEKIFSNTSELSPEALLGFKKFFETISLTKSILFLIGLPDFYECLPKDAKERIADVIKTSIVTDKEVNKYIIRANNKVNKYQSDSLFPFNKDIIKSIVDISNGNIRMILRLCYHCAKKYTEEECEINETLLTRVLNEHWNLMEINDIKQLVLQMVLSRGWNYDESKTITVKKGSKTIDLWLPSVLTKNAQVNFGIEMYFAKNILSKAEYDNITGSAYCSQDNKTILILEGFIMKKYLEPLSKVFNHVIMYNSYQFKITLASILEGEKIKLENSQQKNHFDLMDNKIDEIYRMITHNFEKVSDKFLNKDEFYYYIQRLKPSESLESFGSVEKNSYFSLIEVEIGEIKKKLCYRDCRAIGTFELLKQIINIVYLVFENPSKINLPRRIKATKISSSVILDSFTSINDAYLDDIEQKICRDCQMNSVDNVSLKKYKLLLELVVTNLRDIDVTKNLLASSGNPECNTLLNLRYNKSLSSIIRLNILFQELKQFSEAFNSLLLLNEPFVLIECKMLFVEFHALLSFYLDDRNQFELTDHRNEIIQHKLDRTHYTKSVDDFYNPSRVKEILYEYSDVVDRYYSRYMPNYSREIEKIGSEIVMIIQNKRF